MSHDLDQTISLLTRTPPTLHALLRDLPDSWTHSNEGPETWTLHEIIAHLIHGEHTDWMPRARWILQFADSRPFEAFDREGQRRESEDKPLAQLLNEFAEARQQNLAALRELNLRQDDLARPGLHPALGPVTLSQLLATWSVHDLTHLHQISRVLAHQYRRAVGPWSAYLGVLQCNGHSS